MAVGAVEEDVGIFLDRALGPAKTAASSSHQHRSSSSRRILYVYLFVEKGV